MPVKPGDQRFAFVIPQPISNGKQGAIVDELFITQNPNVIQTSNISIPYIAQERNENPIIVAIKIFGFTR